jgi:ascorbate PTS system EIIC component
MLKFILDVISVPAFLIGIVALIGLLLQKKELQDIISGTIKTALGFVILGGGASILISALSPLGIMFSETFHVRGIIPNNEAIVALSIKEYGSTTTLIMIIGMLVNILIAKYTPLKYIFLTGHHIFYMASLISIILILSNMSTIWVIIIGGIILGIIMTLSPAIAQPFMKKITSADDVAFAHFNTIGYVISALIGKVVGKNSRSTETINVPQKLSFLRDSSLSIALTMSVIYIVICILAGKDFVEQNLSNGQNFIVFAILQSLLFAAAVYIIMQGVRLFLAEITPAFVGISEKLVKNAKPALDCPVVFTYAPNAVLIGFLASFTGGLLGLLILGKFSTILILPGIIAHFFTGATAGVFGNSTGGIKGAIIGAFVNGLIITFFPILLLSYLGDLGLANTTFSDTDFAFVGIVISTIVSLWQ